MLARGRKKSKYCIVTLKGMDTSFISFREFSVHGEAYYLSSASREEEENRDILWTLKICGFFLSQKWEFVSVEGEMH